MLPSNRFNTWPGLTLALMLFAQSALPLQAVEVIRINQNFEGGMVGKVEKLEETRFRIHVPGQHDERGRNRQANWYYFRMDGIQDRVISVTLTDFVGEYNDTPGACAMNAETVPVFSYDNEHWEHFPAMTWNPQSKEATLQFSGRQDRIWIAHVPPYTHTRLLRLLDELNRSPQIRVEVIGKTVQQRDLHLVTVTNFEKPDQAKKVVWLQARQHAWETGTSFVMEGALRFISSEDPAARKLRDAFLFKFTPMMDPDGCASGKVRFNANGYDVNRHWDEVDLRSKQHLENMPEIWYVKKAILAQASSGQPIDLMLNLHNTETAEYVDTQCDDENTLGRMHRCFDALVEHSSFDPSQKFRTSKAPSNTTNCLWDERKVPVMLMEQRISGGPKLGHRPTTDDRLQFGCQLIAILAESAR